MKPAIPPVNTGNGDVDRFAEAVKQTLDGMTGQQKNVVKLVPLPDTATSAEQIAQLNAMLARLQG
jgi:mannose/fructose-specific phosphotransferase system component IIA